MNKSLTTKEWWLLSKRVRIESLNHTMLLAYKVSLLTCYFLLFLFPVYFLRLTLTLSLQFLAALNQTYIATHILVEKGTVYGTKFLKATDELEKKKARSSGRNWVRM